MQTRMLITCFVLQPAVHPGLSVGQELVPPIEGFHFIDTSFENASPLDWDIYDSRIIHIRLLQDHERSSPNRQGGHWHFKLEAAPGSQWTIILSDGFDTIWNGRRITPL